MVVAFNEFESKRMIAPARRHLAGASSCWAALVEWRKRERLRRSSPASATLLRDIGLTRDDVNDVATNWAFDARIARGLC
jgi:uncharacterized protein YjiS (DUF1127 family)